MTIIIAIEIQPATEAAAGEETAADADTREADAELEDGETQVDAEQVTSARDETGAEGATTPGEGVRGDEDEVESNEILRSDEDAERIPDDFFYDYAAEMCKPFVTEDSGLPGDLVTLQYPFIARVNVDLLFIRTC